MCGNCGHPWDDHGDRAIAACANGVRSALSPWRKVVCPCTGYSHGEPTMSYLPPLLPDVGGLILPGDRPPTVWERMRNLNRR